MKPTVFVLGSGGGVGISIIKSARIAKYKVIASDMEPLSAGLLMADKGYMAPPIKSENYIPFIMDVCVKEKIDAIIPGSDHHLQILAHRKKEIEKNTGVKVVIGNFNAVVTGRSKILTQRFLEEKGFNYCNTVYEDRVHDIVEKHGFPLIIKPDSGSGSVGLYKVEDEAEVQFYSEALRKRGLVPVIQEYLSPDDQEYTTGVMFSKGRELLGSITLKRKIKKGDSYRTWSDDYPEVRLEMEKVAKALETPGPLNLQCRLTERGPVIFEINPRFSGTSCVRSFLGFNDVKMVVDNFLYDTIPESTDYKKGVCMVRYLNEVYVTKNDLDNMKKGELLVNF